MKKFLNVFVTPLLSSIIILIHIPAVEKWLKIEEWINPMYLTIGVVSCVILSHIIGVISPLNKYEKLEKNKWALINELARLVIEDPFFSKYNLTANVMIVKRPFFNQREPHPKNSEKRRWAFFCPMFKFIWSYNGKAIDKRVKLTINQGSSGMAYRQGDVVLKHAHLENWDDFNLNVEQKKAISDLQLIISCPIFAFDKYNKPTDKIIGVLNVSSNSKSVKLLIKRPEDRRILCEKTAHFSHICSLIM